MNKKGFTIVELLAAISILSILIIIAVPSYNKVSKDTKEASLENKKNAIKSAMLNYANKHLLDEIKPEGNDCSGSGSCCKAYSIDYILENNIYYTDTLDEDGKKVEYNPVNNQVLDGYIEVYFNKSKYILTSQYVEKDNRSCEEVSIQANTGGVA